MKKPKCDIPNCPRPALNTSIFCGPHDRANAHITAPGSQQQAPLQVNLHNYYFTKTGEVVYVDHDDMPGYPYECFAREATPIEIGVYKESKRVAPHEPVFFLFDELKMQSSPAGNNSPTPPRPITLAPDLKKKVLELCDELIKMHAPAPEAKVLKMQVQSYIKAAEQAAGQQLQDLTQAINFLGGDVTRLQGQITTVQGQLTTANAYISELETKVNLLTEANFTLSESVGVNSPTADRPDSPFYCLAPHGQEICERQCDECQKYASGNAAAGDPTNQPV